MGDWGFPQKGWNLNGSVACKILDSSFSNTDMSSSKELKAIFLLIISRFIKFFYISIINIIWSLIRLNNVILNQTAQNSFKIITFFINVL